jgi:hypothetical protein
MGVRMMCDGCAPCLRAFASCVVAHELLSGDAVSCRTGDATRSTSGLASSSAACFCSAYGAARVAKERSALPLNSHRLTQRSACNASARGARRTAAVVRVPVRLRGTA